jgi:DNA recombination protein RmuC
MSQIEIVLIVLLAIVLVLQILALLRQGRAQDQGVPLQLQQLQQALALQHQQGCERAERAERDLRAELQLSAQGTRQELGGNFAQFQQALSTQLTSVATLQNKQIENFAQQLAKLSEANAQQLEAMRLSLSQAAQHAREEQSVTMKRFGDTLGQTMAALTESTAQRMAEMRAEQGAAMTRFGETLTQRLAALTESNAQRMAEVRATLETKIRDLQTDNALRLEEMRKTVDEKLHATLEHRLANRSAGLRAARESAPGPGRDAAAGDRRGRPEARADQREDARHLGRSAAGDAARAGADARPVRQERRMRPRHRRARRVRDQAAGPERQPDPVLAAGRRQVPEGAVRAPVRGGREGRRRGRAAWPAANSNARCASRPRPSAEKYLSPPQTTDFAILFLPTEGLYAEVMRRPGLADELQRTCRVTIAGPSTLTALLNSLQMGFRTLALEKRSSEVWQVLGAVKTEFGKFGDVLAATKLALEKVTRKNIDQAEVRSRQMARKLKTVEALPSEVAQQLLGVDVEPVDD